MIAANNGHVLAYDNLSRLPSWLSDALCRLVSGGGFGLRQLFTDENEILFHAIRPAILNGIEDVVCRADLADRAVFLTLEPTRAGPRRSFGANSRLHAPASLAPCSMAPSKAYANCPTFVSKSCRAWPILRCGGRPARRPSGRRVRSYAPMTPTVGQRSTGSSRPIRWPPLCGNFMAERGIWAGRASDLLGAHTNSTSE